MDWGVQSGVECEVGSAKCTVRSLPSQLRRHTPSPPGPRDLYQGAGSQTLKRSCKVKAQEAGVEYDGSGRSSRL